MEKTRSKKNVYIKAPPGCGKTVLLCVKAMKFLRENDVNIVIQVNMYRGAKGRAIGKYIDHLIKKCNDNAIYTIEGIPRVNHLQV